MEANSKTISLYPFTPTDVRHATGLPLDLQGLHYTFWAPFNHSGKFLVEGVRPGNYSLWIYWPGCVPTQQLVIPHVVVGAGKHDA